METLLRCTITTAPRYVYLEVSSSLKLAALSSNLSFMESLPRALSTISSSHDGLQRRITETVRCLDVAGDPPSDVVRSLFHASSLT